MRDAGVGLGRIWLHADASAAIGVIDRKGAGKLRHISTNALWLQDEELKEEIRLLKVDGSKNPADLMTKHVERELAESQLRKLSFFALAGRAMIAAQAH